MRRATTLVVGDDLSSGGRAAILARFPPFDGGRMLAIRGGMTPMGILRAIFDAILEG
jgi:hypothetical protein